MALNFCPECGTKLQTGFKFCPSCGEKLPSLEDHALTVSSTSSAAASQITVTHSPSCPKNTQKLVETVADPVSAVSVSVRPPLRRGRKSTKVDLLTTPPKKTATPLLTASPKSPAAGQSPKASRSPQKRKVHVNVKQEEVITTEVVSSLLSRSPAVGQSPTASPSPRKRSARANVNHKEEVNVEVLPTQSPKSPGAGKNRTKRIKHSSAPEPLQEGEQVTDTAGRKWTLVSLLSQGEAELIYGVQQGTSGAASTDYKHVLKLAAKDGKIFNEQNFLQRAAKPTSVKNWMKQKKMEFLGIPSCVGFGLHADKYRFLIFPDMGQSLQSIMEKVTVLSEKVVLQLSCRILDVLEYIHDNEYVHADIHSENVYVDLTKPTEVHLVGYCHAFRYCPSGKHVEYREGSRTPHEGAVEFISVESHKGAGPSRRSDLQALGYCMLNWLTGSLPWTSLTDCPAKVMAVKERFMTDVPGLLSQCFGRKKVPGAMRAYLSQVMSLQYTEEPNYQQLRDGLLEALQRLGVSLDHPIDLQV